MELYTILYSLSTILLQKADGSHNPFKMAFITINQNVKRDESPSWQIVHPVV